MDRWDNIIIEVALNFLAELEKKKAVLKFNVSDIKKNLPFLIGKQPTDAYIQMILDDEFSKRYDGKYVVYFLKVK